MKKRWLLGIIVIFVVALGVVQALLFTASGSKLLQYINNEGVCIITLEKSVVNSEVDKLLKSKRLSSEELAIFYELLSNSKFRSIGYTSFPYNSEIEYNVFFEDNGGNQICTMKFKDDDLLIFDLSTGRVPAIHERYEILSSQLISYFEQILLA